MDKTISKENIEKRLAEIDIEIAELASKQAILKDKWLAEKVQIQTIQSNKEKIEQAKHQAEEFERIGDLAKVAELRYGVIHSLETELRAASEKLAELQIDGKILKEEVDAEDIAEILSKWTGIPVKKMLESERMKLLEIEDRIKARVIGQDLAANAVANAIRRSRAGLQDPNRPIGSFIFLGSTGVGKTEMAKALAEYLFDDENAIVRIDMSEYMEKFSVSKLIGAPPGYVGYDEGGQLTESIRRKPYSVVLLDEIEKANPDVFNILLQVLDDGRLTDGKGRTVNFKNTIIIMTSNLGSDIINAHIGDIKLDNKEQIMQKIQSEMAELLRNTLRPEFLNRIDETIVFNPLTPPEIIKIAKLNLDVLTKRVNKNGISIEYSNATLQYLAKVGFDIAFGARPLKRIIQKLIINPLSIELLSGKFVSGDKIIVKYYDKSGITFEKAE